MTAVPTSGVRPGDILAGKYRVERVLGEGGMGIVVAAHHLQLDEKVALKFLLPEALKSPAAVQRFVREARAAVKIKSEHVARISDVGQLENGAPYMVMEYLEGGDLDGWVRQRGALPIEQAVDFVLQACVAVADAHALGIIHRDLKPANLFCVRRSDGQLSIKVLDFGISKMTSNGVTGPSVAMTKTSAVMGSPLYMSPEQMQSTKTVDTRTDLWALGIVLYELIAGKSPFDADTVMELAVKIATAPPPPLRGFRPDVPPGLETVIVKCLQKEPAGRYRNVGELAVALLPFAPKRSKSSVERISGIIQSAGLSASALDMPPSPQVEQPAMSPGTMSAVGRTTNGASHGKPALIGVGVAAVILFGTLATYALLGRKSVEGATGSVAAASPSSSPSTAASPTTPALAAEPPAPASETPPTVASASPAAPALSAPTARASSTHASSTKTTHTVASPPPPAPPPVAQPSCDPPYTINAAGHRVHKPECP